MRSPNSPFTAEVADEWEYLVTAGRMELTLGEQQARWQRLMDGAWSDGSWSVSHHDAGIIADLGITLAMQIEDFALARDLVGRMFAHPDMVMSTDNEIDIADFWIRGALADILCGDVEEGLMSLRRPFTDEPFSQGFNYPAMLRHELRNLFWSLRLGKAVDPRIGTFTAELIAHFPRCAAKSRKAFRASSYGQLNHILDSTYAKRRRK